MLQAFQKELRSLTPMARGGMRTQQSKTKPSGFDSKKHSELQSSMRAQPHKSKPVISRPASRSCMITYDVFGYSRPITATAADAVAVQNRKTLAQTIGRAHSPISARRHSFSQQRASRSHNNINNNGSVDNSRISNRSQ